MSTLYESLGGSAAIEAAVDDFYRRVLADERIGDIFSGIDMERLKQHQRRFLSFAFGGPSDYEGRDIATAHRRIAERHGLDDGHFDAVLGHLGDTLDALGVAASLRYQALAVAESARGQVLGRGLQPAAVPAGVAG